jgi:hypothetical protein
MIAIATKKENPSALIPMGNVEMQCPLCGQKVNLDKVILKFTRKITNITCVYHIDSMGNSDYEKLCHCLKKVLIIARDSSSVLLKTAQFTPSTFILN